ncbi:GerAB/ArcD/ProY family transporter [Paenibacillus sedimenti]|uniref:GerAB/ArcD/ProY family transporter n=1 Tax=Paenibacillus sedimenti TaxID=2770274 RepID=A0A926KVF8_9BACL|nr:GerAB/ArcD/ProY family transporter [Paenibacillus sedimenti]MBD0382928.1 GerAB/ArcD/ProY family transporter [Paenibacillus sedimenti]
MSGKTVINPNQLFAMLLLFEAFGTALVVPIGFRVGQGVWLAILIAMPAGILLYLLYDYLLRQYPDLILSGYLRVIFGNYIGSLFSLIYINYFVYNAARILREGGDLLISASYDRTPSLVVHAVMIAAVIYILHKGIEVFFRLAEIYIIIILTLASIATLTILLSGVFEPRNLLPLTGEGWTSILRSAYPYIFTFPFSELICFTTILPHLNNVHSARKIGLTAIIISAAILSMTHAMDVAVLGDEIYSRTTFPLFTTISIVRIGEFLQRLDAIVMLTLIIGVFFKMSVYCYAVMALVSDIFKIAEQRKLAYPVGIVVLFLSIMSAWSFPEHNEEGQVGLEIILPSLSVVIPVLAIIIHWIRKRLNLYPAN